MSATESPGFAQSMRRIEALVGELEHCTDPSARIAAQEMVRTLLEVHGAALAGVLELLSAAGEPGRAVLESCVKDERVGSVLLLHQLHPHDLPTRVQLALERARAALRPQGGELELLDITEGVIHLRLQTGRHGCGSTAARLRELVEQAVADAAPDLAGLEWDEPAAAAPLLQLGLLARDGRTPQPAGQAPLIPSGSQ
jgi:Fe-S cluster biogenesis protein NfuA